MKWMGLPFGKERRDPASGILKLGQILSCARRGGHTGSVEVRDQGRTHTIHLNCGLIADIDLTHTQRTRDTITAQHIEQRAIDLFSLKRPHVLWQEAQQEDNHSAWIDPEMVVISGVLRRQDLFDPVLLIDRIPSAVLRINPLKLKDIQTMPLSREERCFANHLRVSTPVPMILWKRGLAPGHAAAVLVALNLTGCFEETWEPGDLPRHTEIARVRRQLRAGVDDARILGLHGDASPKAVDRAFRRLSFELHPDRLPYLSDGERAAALEAFIGASQAYDRLKRSRRSRPVTTSFPRTARDACRGDALRTVLGEARTSKASGRHQRARAFALKALAMNPTEAIKSELLDILKTRESSPAVA
ncbi:MAG: J domain-containing protein [Myxococcota bacterium]|nr:J domain-containing protein [Myxococcota bacterium]